MTVKYRIFGSELSPYSVKVRSYLRYKGIPHDWLIRNKSNRDEYEKYAKLPLIPLVVTPDGEGIQDSTPIIERLECKYPEPSIHPSDPVAAFVSTLIEEYSDEWCNKPMFHYRWHYEPDQISTAERIAASAFEAEGDALKEAADSVRKRMVGRLHFVGSSKQNRPVIEGSFHRLLDLLETHLAERPYLFGHRPAFGDFGLAAELYECSTDPTAGTIIRESAPNVLDWCERMLNPSAEGEFESWQSVSATLLPVLKQEVAGVFLPWSDANARALEAGEERVSLEIDGYPYSQDVQKYHARSLAVLRQKYAALDAYNRGAIDVALVETGCLKYLQTPD